MTQQTLLKRLEEQALNGATPGFAVSVWRESRPAIKHAFGTASGEIEVVTQNTLYDIASITKLFTAALVLRLHEDGKLNIFERVGDFLPQFAESELLIVDLLSHRASFGLRLTALRELGPQGFAAALWSSVPPKSRSHRVEYENITYLCLGKLVESVTGRSLRSNMQGLLNCLDLKEVRLCDVHVALHSPPTERTETGIVQGITHDESARMLGGLAGNAGVFASATALSSFAAQWMSGEVVSLPFLNRIVLRNYDEAGTAAQALGWWMRIPGVKTRYDGLYSHTGFTGCLLAFCPGSRIAGALTCNRSLVGRTNTRHYQMWELLLDYMRSCGRL